MLKINRNGEHRFLSLLTVLKASFSLFMKMTGTGMKIGPVRKGRTRGPAILGT